jgi:hypothetical protein
LDPIAQPGDDGRARAVDDACERPGAFDPLIPNPGETCWTFHAHDLSSPTDTSELVIQPGESYSQLYYDVPWPAGSIATRFGSQLDNVGLLRHWLLFSSTAAMPHGTVARNVTGTTLGENAELLAAWAVGGCNVTYPDDVGGVLPDSGKLMVQWHHYNDTAEAQPDGSEIQICTVPAGSRPHLGGLTMLGTENIGDPSRIDADEHEREFGSTCINDSAAPITLIGFLPHMHQLGTRMRSIANKSTGASETIFDQPFTPQRQSNYVLRDRYVLAPGESITSTCTYRSDDVEAHLAFGQSWHQEFCYQYAFSYPHDALSNGVFSLIGATNTCWSFP